MAEDDIARLLQNAEFEEILPEERNVHGINVVSRAVDHITRACGCNMIYCNGQYSPIFIQ
jgi:hypothetical protein